MYLNTPFTQFKYMHIPLVNIPQQITDEYNLNDIVIDKT